jgi:hypothetical protein
MGSRGFEVEVSVALLASAGRTTGYWYCRLVGLEEDPYLVRRSIGTVGWSTSNSTSTAGNLGRGAPNSKSFRAIMVDPFESSSGIPFLGAPEF